MSLNKAVESGKEHRKKYTGGKSVSEHCRNHGGRRHSWECEWCLGNRLHKYKKAKLKGDVRFD